MVMTIVDDSDKFGYGHEINQLVNSDNGNGVYTGMTVTCVSGNRQTTVASGFYIANGTRVKYAGATLAAHDAAGNNRYDLIQANSAGTVSIKKGTEASSPIVPDPDANNIILATIWLPIGVTVLTTAGNVTDMRVPVHVVMEIGACSETTTFTNEFPGTPTVFVTNTSVYYFPSVSSVSSTGFSYTSFYWTGSGYAHDHVGTYMAIYVCPVLS